VVALSLIVAILLSSSSSLDNAPTSTDITEKEVRALFELWNSALATGDSRIVASRYTKVSYTFSLPHQETTFLMPMHLTDIGHKVSYIFTYCGNTT
jgi:hypothetical protein